jgi:hypothetical protein
MTILCRTARGKGIQPMRPLQFESESDLLWAVVVVNKETVRQGDLL